MLTTEQRARFTIVLVGARNPQNIGAAARAMQDFGFSDLRFVNDYTVALEAAQTDAAIAATREGVKSAVGAHGVLAAARAFPSVAAAVADCTHVVGTTAIGARQVEHPIESLAAAAPKLLTSLVHLEARVALLFGSEKTGLTNDQLSFCQSLLTIPLFAPAGERHLSMNLGQSVAVCLYELTREGFEGARPFGPAAESGPAGASGADRERLTHLLTSVMQQSGYARRFPANARETVVRRLAHSLGINTAEAQTWMGLLKLLLHRLAPEK